MGKEFITFHKSFTLKVFLVLCECGCYLKLKQLNSCSISFKNFPFYLVSLASENVTVKMCYLQFDLFRLWLYKACHHRWKLSTRFAEHTAIQLFSYNFTQAVLAVWHLNTVGILVAQN